MPIKIQQKHFHRLYLAGPITGVPDYKERFAEAERDFSEHYDVINPARILEGVDDRDCLPLCLRLIDRADSVVLLPGWRSSMGAVTEALYAVRQGKDVTAFERKDAAYSVSWDGEKLTIGSDEKARKWIPCSERLPGESGFYLATYRERWDDEVAWGPFEKVEVRKIHFTRTTAEWTTPAYLLMDDVDLEQHVQKEVLAWMELPEPYEEANK
jgi:hypothetical protein